MTMLYSYLGTWCGLRISYSNVRGMIHISLILHPIISTRCCSLRLYCMVYSLCTGGEYTDFLTYEVSELSDDGLRVLDREAGFRR